MSRLSKASLYNALENAGNIIRSASGNDTVTSRSDIRKKLSELRGAERSLVESLYRFIDQRDKAKGARITHADITSAIENLKSNLIEPFDFNHNGFSQAEIARMSAIGQSISALAMQLKRSSQQAEIHSGADLKNALEALCKGMIFTGFGSEGDDPVHPVLLNASLEKLDAQALADALRYDTSTPSFALERVYPYSVGLNFELIDTLSLEEADFGRRAGEIARLMTENLKDLIVVIFGKDMESPPQHPFYWVGLHGDGSIVGLTSVVIWT